MPARQITFDDLPTESPLLTTNTAAQNATALNAYLLANKKNGIAKAVLEPGDYKMGAGIDVAALKAAGVTKVVIIPRVPGSVRFLNVSDVSAISFDASAGASAPLTVSAISLQLHNTYDYLHRLTVTGLSTSGWSKNDRINIQSQDRPPYSSQRFVGEAFRARTVDTTNDFLWVDGRLEYSYATSIVVRKLDATVKLRVHGIKFAPDGDSSNLAVTNRTAAMVTVTAAVDCRLTDCEFDAPWYLAVRFNSCVDCSVERSKYWNGLNNPIADQLTYGLNCYGACHNCWMIDCFSSGFRHTFTTDGWAASTAYSTSNWASYGQPTWCGARNSRAVNAKGAPWDTHEEGARIFFTDCHSDMAHSADEAGVFVGGAFQVRCARVTIQGCSGHMGNTGISWKPFEHGTDNWLRIIDTVIGEGTYSSDQSRGIYISTGGTLTNRPKLYLENTTVDIFGNSLESDLAVDIEVHGFKSSRPHRSHMNLATGCVVRGANVTLDSRSANLPGAAVANRVLDGIILEGTAECHLHNVMHILHSDTTKAPSVFKSADTTAGKKISLTQYHEQDPSNIGRRPLVFAGHEAYFIWVGMDATTRVAKANLPAAGRQGRQAFVTDEVGGPQPAFDNGTAWKRFSDGATVS
jgi:hypothetical protein